MTWAVPSAGTKLSYVSAGTETGMPVRLLRAWGESRRSFDRLLPLLPRALRAISIDQRGHGQSGKPPVGYLLAGMAADVRGFMEAPGIESAIRLGSSSGGHIAQQVAVSVPDRVWAMVLVGSPRSLQGCPAFADEVERLADPVDPGWVRQAQTWFLLFHPAPWPSTREHPCMVTHARRPAG